MDASWQSHYDTNARKQGHVCADACVQSREGAVAHRLNRLYEDVRGQSPCHVAAHKRVHFCVVDRNRSHYDTDAHKQSRYCAHVHVLVCARAGVRLTFPGLARLPSVRPLASVLALAPCAGLARG